MAEEFYVGRGDKRFGPFSAARLRELAAAGQFRAGDTIWTEGMEKPVLAVKVKNLFPAAPPPVGTDTPAAAAKAEAPVPPAAEETSTQPSAGRTAVEDIPTLPGPLLRSLAERSCRPSPPRKRGSRPRRRPNRSGCGGRWPSRGP